jgi:prepilin-type N-terminal cleavage/methylation domain-containing protein
MFKERLKQLMHTNGSHGFTLIEVVIAISIFAIGFLAVAALQISANKSSRRALEVTEATAIASNQMERLMSLSFDIVSWSLAPRIRIIKENLTSNGG